MNASLQIAYATARLAAGLRARDRETRPLAPRPCEPGISLVIPSRNGKELLAAQMPAVASDLPAAAEIVVVDNGSTDGTAEWLRSRWPQVRVEFSPEPLSFARAINRGIALARFDRVGLLNNDMRIDPGFFAALEGAFRQVPDLFCATAQIRFPAGVRREETGKAVMAQHGPDDFPLRCDEPLPSEDLTCVLYGSGGCSLYDTRQLRALGGLDTAYEPAYVEDLDLGYRAWQRGWPSVFVAGAGVEHRHRATTSRYYTAAELESILELNYLKFLARAVWSPRTFRRLWAQAIERLRLRAPRDPAARRALGQAAALALAGGPAAVSQLSEDLVIALTNGTVWNFPGRAASGKPRTLVVASSPGAMPARLRQIARETDPVLLALTPRPVAPPPEVLDVCVEVVLVEQSPSARQSMRAALQHSVRRWQPAAAGLESAQMAEFAADCAPARVSLITET